MKLVIDLDGTLTIGENKSYKDALPNKEVIDKLKIYKNNGYEISIYTARNMRTYKKSMGKINAQTLPVIIEWLDKNEVPYDEVHVGKPWCGEIGFYVDDRAIRPSEFVKLSDEEISVILKAERCY